MFSLSGPLFYYEVLRQARKGRGHALRAAYTVFVLLGIAFVYAMTFGFSSLLDTNLDVPHETTKKLSDFADRLALAFLVMQGVAVTVLTPACMASAIVEEKEQRTLELLYTTHLTEPDILISKLFGRLAPVAEMLLAGVPLMGLLALLGGLPFNLTAAMFVATVATAVNYGCLCLMASAMSHKVIEGMFFSLICVVTYIASMGGVAMGIGWLGNLFFPGQALIGVNFISPVTLLFGLEGAQLRSGGFDAGCYLRLGLFIAIQLLCACAFFLMAWWRMRRDRKAERFQRVVREGRWRSRQVEEVVTAPQVILVAEEPMPALEEPVPVPADTPAIPTVMLVAERPSRRPKRRRRRRDDDDDYDDDFIVPPPQGDPLVWKEVQWHRVAPEAQTIFSVLYIVGFTCLLLGILLAGAIGLMAGRASYYQTFAAGALSMLGVPMTLFLCVMSGYKAASCIVRERAAKTWDSLLTLPVPRAEVFKAKLKGCLITLKPCWYGALLVWVTAGLILAVPLHASPLLLLHIAVVALFLTVLGLWLSLRCKSLLQAQVQMGVWLVIQFLGLWPFGLSPLANWWFLIFDSNKVHRASFVMDMIGVVVSMIIWAGLGFVLWVASVKRLQGDVEGA